MQQQRGLLLSFMGVQLLLVGAFFYRNHHLRDFTSFLRLLIQDRSEVREELPLLVQVSPPGIFRQDVYSNLSQIHPVDIREEDLPNCPIISPYISKLGVGLPDPQPHPRLWGDSGNPWESG